ncbi:uncharacterized protein CXQ87_005220 [Candidozyma duobushaemuli]|uniref:PHD-type domain-containing protein n=1 Tax=Candidozyma duobushaemuli TaxID=1231522 RepID=A0A2V1AAZ2_9ASCO|nr:uncharacterized protein CXQ87_005220 [[Candida] duobushaemulonis]PVH14942.1 hypothetical protein CXQ87_005220 [[Candida] duobushaemulonis]
MVDPVQPTKAPAPRGRGRPRSDKSLKAAKEEKVPKKRGRKPGSLGKKKLAAQRKSARGETSSSRQSRLEDSPNISRRAAKASRIEDIFLTPGSMPATRSNPLYPNSSPGKTSSTTEGSQEKTFIEPELAAPQPGYSGYPLEALPPQQKIKRPLSGTPRGRKPKGDSSPQATPVPSDIDTTETERKYRAQLETPVSESISTASEIRTPLKGKKRGRKPKWATNPELKSSPSGLKLRIPATPKSSRNGEDSARSAPGSSRTKRLKITSPKKQPTVGLAPAIDNAPESDDSNSNDDFCATCGGTGVFICCDTCPKSFHLLCCEPPIQEIPEENWNCNECRAAQGIDPRKYHNNIGMFGPLINSMHGRNPTEFRLPKKLRDATFIDVTTGPDDNYTDSHLKPELSYSKVNGSQIVGFNKNEDLDIDSLYDKNGRPFLCHRCRESGLNRRTMVSCDYCPLYWHLDCLPEPVSSAKTIGLKWRCPNHIENLVPISWSDRRSFRDCAVVDSGLHSNFIKIMEASNFLIKFEDQGFIAENKQPTLQDYLQFQKEDFISSKSDYVAKFSSKNDDGSDTENDEDTFPLFKVPEYLENYTVGNKVVGKSSKKSARVLLMTNADDNDQKPFIYRVPEKQVLLDFIHKGESSKASVLAELNSYESKKEAEHSRDSKAAEDLQFFSENKSETAVSRRGDPHLNLDELVAAAAATTTTQTTDSAVDNSEIEDLQKIKELMELKGRDALLKFLKS